MEVFREKKRFLSLAKLWFAKGRCGRHKEQEEGGVVTPPARTWARSITWRSTMRRNVIRASWHMPGSADGGSRRKRTWFNNKPSHVTLYSIHPITTSAKKCRLEAKRRKCIMALFCSMPRTYFSLSKLKSVGKWSFRNLEEKTHYRNLELLHNSWLITLSKIVEVMESVYAFRACFTFLYDSC